ncbi:NAD(P)-dependent oxidoreductase [Listeria weihenstephanensis]|uniref:NAD(P)-dependent oxidoreductase n=1 Tax=Listeria weihenstephanensis TaxID=1006155 RepID=A0A841Z6T5_9LIST|nr:NAD(P)-dependent oxidoreductase [Listeria weihenstephanensis]MBC1500579.1 NAD(P)-dependent oxidoreductase [Listeria weihenstephanensis]
MKIGIIGATGRTGSRILTEARNRGHEVTAIVRNASKLSDSSLPAIEKDIFSLTKADVADFDVLVDAFSAPIEESDNHWKSIDHLITELNGTTNPRLIVVGGAASSLIDDKGTRVLDTVSFKEAPYYATGAAQAIQLDHLKSDATFDWTFISPAGLFEPGERTGTYTTGKDELIVDAEGNSYISMEDYAIALVDEAENNKHPRARFTVGQR